MADRRPENEILICVARRASDDQMIGRLRHLLQQDIDWNFLIETATGHGLLPLLFNHLHTSASDLTPGEPLERLKQEFLSNSQCNLYLMRELIRVLEMVGENGIKALAFKGPVLAAQLYGDLALRQAGDLDILIQKEDFLRTKNLLQGAGYLMEPQLTGSQQSSHLRFHCEIQFVHQDQVCVVDLHWGVAPRTFPFKLNPQDLLHRSIPISFAGHSIPTFTQEDLLLYLCMNGSKDTWYHLEAIAAVAELLRSETDLAWSSIWDRAWESGGEKMLLLGLLLSKEVFEVEAAVEGIKYGTRQTEVGRTLESLHQHAQQIEQRLFSEVRRPPTAWQMFQSNLQCMGRKRDAVMALLRAALVPTISDWRVINLPATLYPLYYLLRPVRLLGKYTWGILHHSAIQHQDATSG